MENQAALTNLLLLLVAPVAAVIGALLGALANTLTTNVKIRNIGVENEAKRAETRKETEALVERNRAAAEKNTLDALDRANKNFTEASNQAAAAGASLDIMRQSLVTANENNRLNAITIGEVKGLYTAALREIDILSAGVIRKDDKIGALTAEVTSLKETIATQNAKITNLETQLVTVNDQLKVANEQLTKVLKDLADKNTLLTKAEAAVEHAANVKDDAEAAAPEPAIEPEVPKEGTA